MSRTSSDDLDAAGVVRNGFDYELQVWVKDYMILDCGHPTHMKNVKPTCCPQHSLNGQDIRNVKGHEGLIKL